MKLSNWREASLLLWITILFILAIPLLINNSSTNPYVSQAPNTEAQSKKSNFIKATVPEPATPPSYINQIIRPDPTPRPTSSPVLPIGNMNHCRYYLYNAETSSPGDCSDCRGAYLDDTGGMPICVAP